MYMYMHVMRENIEALTKQLRDMAHYRKIFFNAIHLSFALGIRFIYLPSFPFFLVFQFESGEETLAKCLQRLMSLFGVC